MDTKGPGGDEEALEDAATSDLEAAEDAVNTEPPAVSDSEAVDDALNTKPPLVADELAEEQGLNTEPPSLSEENTQDSSAPQELRALEELSEDDALDTDQPPALEDATVPEMQEVEVPATSLKPGTTLCQLPGISIQHAKGEADADWSRILLNEDATEAQRGAFGRIERFGRFGGLSIEGADERSILVRSSFAGTMSALPSLGWHLPRRLEVFKQVAHLVADFHSNGMAIGVLDPDVILLSDDLTPVILAPGLTTEPGPYGAPESNTKGTYNIASDIYSLGRLLHFTLAQQTPELEYGSSMRLDDLMEEPAGLSRIIRKAVLAEPDRRYQSIAELLEDLDNYADYENVGIAHPGVEEKNFGVRSLRPAAVRVSAKPKKEKKAPEDTSLLDKGLEIQPFKLSGVARITILLSGIVSLGLAIGLSYVAGDPTWVRLLVSLCAGAIGFALWNPGMEREATLRSVFGLFAAMFMFSMNPSSVIAEIAERAGLKSSDSQERADTYGKLKDRGRNKFDNIDFTGADLRGQSFLFTKLNGASFQNADLSEASFMMTELDGANFEGAQLYGTIMKKIELDNVIGIKDALCDETTRFPDGWACVRDHPKRVGPKVEEEVEEADVVDKAEFAGEMPTP